MARGREQGRGWVVNGCRVRGEWVLLPRAHDVLAGRGLVGCIDPRHFLASGRFRCEGADEVAVVSG